jgi:hypothetical protein
VKVTASIYSANLIPGNYVTDTLRYLQVAVRTNPNLIVTSVCADTGLSCVFDATFNLGATNAEFDCREIQLLGLFFF